ncbi:restriction endonuclease subunit S [Methylomicrobium sp. RS1]|nr:restriction endonuclease subunit S [Methylomicrobium sp. RS1]
MASSFLFFIQVQKVKKTQQCELGKEASQGNLNLGLIRTFKIPLPPLTEQHASSPRSMN